MKIIRSEENDKICAILCRSFDVLHSIACPYTQVRWMTQGWASADQFKIETPKEIREKAA